MCNNWERYEREREVRRVMAQNGEQPAIESLVKKINERFKCNITPIRYDEIWFERYDPKQVEWVKGSSDYYLNISSNGNDSEYMYVEVKIKNTTFDATVCGGVRSGQQISKYGCESFYLDIVPVHRNMNDFCERANINKSHFIIMFTDPRFEMIRLISLSEINSLIHNGWKGTKISEFGAKYGKKSYLIPKDATHIIDDLSDNQIRNYISRTISMPK